MISRKEIDSKVKNVCRSIYLEFVDKREEFTQIIGEFRSSLKVASPLSVLSLINDKKKREKEDIIKLFEPNTHVYTRKLLFPDNREFYLDHLSNIPEGYGVLEATDDCGYSIEDIDSYEGIVTLYFYNDVYVNVRGIYDDNIGEYVFNEPGVVSTVGYSNTCPIYYK